MPKNKDWFRRTSWSESDEAEFEIRLKRSKEILKPQFLCIQGEHLLGMFKEDPVANRHLLDAARKLFERVGRDGALWPGEAIAGLGRCAEIEGNVTEALARYEEVTRMPRDQHSPGGWLNFLFLVARLEIRDRYDDALRMLDNPHRYIPPSPVGEFIAHGSQAVIYFGLGEHDKAKDHAAIAIEASHGMESKSPLNAHRKLRVVGDIYPEFRDRVAAIRNGMQ